jgi:hypothetical protein
MRKGWSIDERRQCAVLLQAGKTSKEIAQALGKTKGSVVGMVQRDPDLKKIGFAHSPLPMTVNYRKIYTDRLKKRDGKEIMYGRNIGLPIMHLASHHCRFPLWPHDAKPKFEEQLYCAQTRAGDSSYCPNHKKLCAAKTRGFEEA